MKEKIREGRKKTTGNQILLQKFIEINTRTVSLVSYSEPFLDLTKEDFWKMDQRKKKLMMMHKVLHQRDDVNKGKKEEENWQMLRIVEMQLIRDSKCLFVGWLVGWLYSILTLFRSFNPKLNFKQFSLV